MSPPEAPRARDDVVFRQLADEWVLYDPAANQIHVLNLPAALVWTSCTGELSVDDIVTEVLDSYPESGEEVTVRKDVVETLDRFSSEGLLA